MVPWPPDAESRPPRAAGDGRRTSGAGCPERRL